MNKALKSLLNDRFLQAMLAVVVFASLYPELGSSSGPLPLSHVLDWGVALVFFLHGMGIPTERLRAGLRNYRLHLLVQAFTFGVFPLFFLVVRATVSRYLPPMLELGVFYLCVLPSTISSSVAFTGVARGNVPAAIFNATLSSMLGIFLTPALVRLYVEDVGTLPSFGSAVLSIATTLLLPFVVGQLLHAPFGDWFAKYKPYTTLVDRGVILLLVYAAFCDTVSSGAFHDHGLGVLLLTTSIVVVMLALVLSLTRRAARALGFEVEDEIVAVFCGSKKTLAAGVPMAKVLFGANPGMGMIVLPIMLYHQLQLIVCAMLAERYAARPQATESSAEAK